MIHTRICDLLGIVHPIVLGDGHRNHRAPGGRRIQRRRLRHARHVGIQRRDARYRDRFDPRANRKTVRYQSSVVSDPGGYVRGHLRAQPTVAAFAWARKDQICGIIFSARTMSGPKSCTWPGKFPKRPAPQKLELTSSWRRARKPEAMWFGWRRCRWCR